MAAGQQIQRLDISFHNKNIKESFNINFDVKKTSKGTFLICKFKMQKINKS
jgi:hypothetical protein